MAYYLDYALYREIEKLNDVNLEAYQNLCDAALQPPLVSVNGELFEVEYEGFKCHLKRLDKKYARDHRSAAKYLDAHEQLVKKNITVVPMDGGRAQLEICGDNITTRIHFLANHDGSPREAAEAAQKLLGFTNTELNEVTALIKELIRLTGGFAEKGERL